MANYSKHIVTGAFMADSKFPLDCETLAALQNNTQLMAVLGNIAAGAADKLILCGCSIEGNYRTEGYVWLRSSGSQLTGEILYHPRQYATQAYGWQVKSVTDSQDPDFPEARPVTVDGVPYPGAYSIRYIKDVLPGGSPWSQFTHIDGISNMALDAALAAEAESRASADTDLGERIDGLQEQKAQAFEIIRRTYNDFPLKEGSDISGANTIKQLLNQGTLISATGLINLEGLSDYTIIDMKVNQQSQLVVTYGNSVYDCEDTVIDSHPKSWSMSASITMLKNIDLAQQ